MGKDVFLSLNEPHKPVSVRHFQNGLLNTIKIVLEDETLKVKACSTRVLGSSLALLRGALGHTFYVLQDFFFLNCVRSKKKDVKTFQSVLHVYVSTEYFKVKMRLVKDTSNISIFNSN